MSEKVIIGYKAIAEYFPFSFWTVQRKYGPDMLRRGYAFKSYLTSKKRPHVWTHESLIHQYLAKLQVAKKRV